MNIQIRDITEQELPQLGALHVQSIKDAYSGFVDQGYLDSLTVEDRVAKWTEWFTPEERPLLMAWDGDVPAGFINFGKLRTAPPGCSPIRPPYTAEIFAFYAAKEYWGKSVGSALFRAAVHRLVDMRHESLCLWVLEDNARAVSFYKNKGGQRCGKQMIEMGPSRLKEICYGWRKTKDLL